MFVAWAEDDRDIALGLQADDDARCSGCGHPLDESMDPKNERLWDTHARPCYSCRAVQQEQRALSEAGGDTTGLMWHTSKDGDQ